MNKNRIVQAGRWLTGRRNVLLAPVFAVAVLAARWADTPWREFLADGAGALCLLAGIRLRLVAASYHESIHQSEPITAGPYAWVRHPLYLANFLLGLGIVLVAGWWPMMFFYCLFFLPLHTLIARSEELHLIELYGEKYLAYQRAVPAILPWRIYGGRRYGSRSDLKLHIGKERLKVVGYAAGAGLILVLKVLRPLLLWVNMPPARGILMWAWATVALLCIVFHSKARPSRVRVLLLVLAIGSVLLLATHLPGVWPR